MNASPAPASPAEEGGVIVVEWKNAEISNLGWEAKSQREEIQSNPLVSQGGKTIALSKHQD